MPVLKQQRRVRIALSPRKVPPAYWPESVLYRQYDNSFYFKTPSMLFANNP